MSLFKGSDHDRYDDNDPSSLLSGDNDTRRAISQLIQAGDSLAFYYTSHGQGCNCVPCQRVAGWKQAKAEAERLL
jgi:hypothetical protein